MVLRREGSLGPGRSCRKARFFLEEAARAVLVERCTRRAPDRRAGFRCGRFRAAVFERTERFDCCVALVCRNGEAEALEARPPIPSHCSPKSKDATRLSLQKNLSGRAELWGAILIVTSVKLIMFYIGLFDQHLDTLSMCNGAEPSSVAGSPSLSMSD